MDQPRKVAKPARGQKNKEIKCPCRYISGMYIYMYNTRTAVCIYVFIYQVLFLFGDMYIRARFTAVYACL